MLVRPSFRVQRRLDNILVALEDAGKVGEGDLVVVLLVVVKCQQGDEMALLVEYELQLGRHLRVCTKLQLNLIFELVLLALLPCEDGMPVGVGIGGTPEAGLFITGLGFLEEFLIVGQVDTGLAGTVVGDEILNWETALPTQNLGEPIL